MTKHIEELKEIARLQLGIMVLIIDSSYVLGSALIYRLFFVLGFVFDLQ